ncbi:hypothetical protein MHC_03175 [Mycoplasma haemocanis str. Illinois]|uniref:Uncharacterized protein n=1 Tax=Mycoplasma haemocanis (strain Illinois) TaxID=1111676 RepID=H6N773_MYCHN|nr:hypothetical protein [Mycoplasma haemocanis]AEW45495.2 hypothetical protein MHC_03175 [Mycoplasma haemocanis str. Illinois]
MSKLMFSAIGVGGISVASVGGYMIIKRKAESTAKTFRNAYSLAILEDKDSLWNSKFEALKSDSQTTPSHPKLIEAKAKFAVQTSNENAKQLQKEGCGEIYDSKLEGTTYLQDFQKYCSKTIKNGISDNWITQPKTDSSKWDPKLTALKTHNISQYGELDTALKNLKSQLLASTGNDLDENKRGILKEWCDGVQGEIFMGDKDAKFMHAKLYCTGSQ